MKAITTKMKNAGIAKVIVSRGINSLKFFVTDSPWKHTVLFDFASLT